MTASRPPQPRFHWLRWSGALAAVASATWLGIIVSRAALFDDAAWWSVLGDDLDRMASGHVSPPAVVRWAVVVMVLALAWITLSLLLVLVSYRRSISSSRPIGRWAALFVCGGAIVASSMAAATPAVASPTTAFVGDRNPAPEPVVVRGVSNLHLAGTAVVSGLIGAGLAVRLRAQGHRSRRRGDRQDAIEGSIPSGLDDDVLGRLCRAEKSLDDIVGVVDRLRCLAPDGEIRHVIDEHNGWFVVEFTHPVKAIPHTQKVTNRSVRLRPDPMTVSPAPIDETNRPMLIHVGRAMSGEVWVSLDAYRDFAIDCASDEGERVWKHLCDSLVLSPVSPERGVVSDVDLEATGHRRIFRVGEGTTVTEGARRIGDSIAVAHGGQGPSGVPTVRRVTTGVVESGLSCSSGEWRLLPVDIVIHPVGIDDDIRHIRDLLGDPLPVIDITDSSSSTTDDHVADIDAGWTFMACVLGPPCVVDRNFDAVEFERSKAEELVIWLAYHPRQRKRSLARTALWLSPIQDATFSNITAAARRSLNAVARPPEGENWVGITLSDDLPLADHFATDVDFLRDTVDRVRLDPEDNGVERLRAALQLVRGVPFAGSTYTWSDGIGMSGDAATLVVRAATMMAEMCQDLGDMGGVYWATAKGLLALPGHEELVAIRLRAHAEHGDRVAMRAEWESYRRAVASEWGDAEPSPKMMDLWRRLGVG
jgi:hypothetical protein